MKAALPNTDYCNIKSPAKKSLQGKNKFKIVLQNLPNTALA
jgi:hypothetical protein